MSRPLTEPELAAVLDRLGVRLLVRGWLSANNIVIIGSGGAPSAVVDTGYVTHAAQTLDLVRHALGGKPLSLIVNTHLHSDHCGGNFALRTAWPEATISVPLGYQLALSPWDDASLSFKKTGQSCEPFEATDFLRPGTSVQLGDFRWEVHSAPGHDPDAIVLYEPQSSVLISGDALWEERLAVIFPELAGEPGFDRAHAALDMIERLRPKVVLPGHGRAFSDVARAIEQSRARLHAFSQAPDRHRKHAARALVTYRMLEVRTCGREDLAQWIGATQIFLDALQCAGDAELTTRLAQETIQRLVDDGVLAQLGDSLVLRDRI